ncbi:MAG: hypothetical protein ACOYI8_07580 [Christensenellales bacterium]|jgi:hypothetical protein
MEQFPIGFWNYPSIDTMEVGEVKVWADCGMTVTMSPQLPIRPDSIRKLRLMLDECTKYGLKLIIRDERLVWDGASDDPEGYRAKFRGSLEDFGNHPATYGFFVGDEPRSKKEFADCKTALRIQKEEAPNLFGFLNFLPYWPGIEDQYFGGKPFDKWAEEFVASSDCRLFSYDCYTQLNPEEEGTDRYFLNLNKFMKATTAANIPLWTTLLSVGHFRYRVPTEDDLRWQFNTAVASGCKGILWFFFYGMNFRNYRGAPINQYREKTICYDWMSLLQRNFRDEYGSLMMSLRLKSCHHIVKAYGEYPYFPENTHPTLRRVFSEHRVPGIVSLFEDAEGREYVVLVNNSPFESDLFKLAVRPDVKHIYNVRKNGSDEKDMKDFHGDAFYRIDDVEAQAGVWLAPGQMEIFRIEA